MNGKSPDQYYVNKHSSIYVAESISINGGLYAVAKDIG